MRTVVLEIYPCEKHASEADYTDSMLIYIIAESACDCDWRML